MSIIEIRRKHRFPQAEARKHADRLARDLRREFGLDTRWRENVLEFSRDGIEGRLELAEDEVRLHARLGFLLSLLRPKIEASIHQHMDELFADDKESRPDHRTRRSPDGRKRPARRRS